MDIVIFTIVIVRGLQMKSFRVGKHRKSIDCDDTKPTIMEDFDKEEET